MRNFRRARSDQWHRSRALQYELRENNKLIPFAFFEIRLCFTPSNPFSFLQVGSKTTAKTKKTEIESHFVYDIDEITETT